MGVCSRGGLAKLGGLVGLAEKRVDDVLVGDGQRS